MRPRSTTTFGQRTGKNTMTGFAHVLKPGRIGTLELPNRVIMAPMGTEMGTPEGLFTEGRSRITPNARAAERAS